MQTEPDILRAVVQRISLAARIRKAEDDLDAAMWRFDRALAAGDLNAAEKADAEANAALAILSDLQAEEAQSWREA